MAGRGDYGFHVEGNDAAVLDFGRRIDDCLRSGEFRIFHHVGVSVVLDRLFGDASDTQYAADRRGTLHRADNPVIFLRQIYVGLRYVVVRGQVHGRCAARQQSGGCDRSHEETFFHE